jgi:PadR family transcriptional regulator, regulatory protein AphA
MERSRTPFVLLGMLAIGGVRSGYEIRKAIETSVGHFWGESYGQIYPTLKRLAKKGLIEPVQNGGTQRRQEYRITPSGRDHLRQWLTAPFENDPPRNEFLLKLFFAAEASPEVAIAHIRDLQERNRRALRMMEEIEVAAPRINAGEPGLKYWMLTLGLGVAMTRAALAWGEQALAQLEAYNVSASITR